jgi:ABC-type uncharacterized transport system substrate-binding protein
MCPESLLPWYGRGLRPPALVLRGWLMLLALYMPTPALSESVDVVIVVSSYSKIYVALASRVESGLPYSRKRYMRTIDVAAVDDLKLPDVIVAVGLKATQAVANRFDVPVISTLIPRSSFEEIARQRQGKNFRASFSAVYLDQPLGRQLDLIRLALPGRKRIGVVFGPQSRALSEAIHSESRSRNLTLQTVMVNNEVGLRLALEPLLLESDVLLSLPDPAVFNSSTISSVLFTSYRIGVPVVGFSPAYVRAGAMVAVHSSPEQFADQVLDMLSGFARESRALPPPQYPNRFSVIVNPDVARALDLVLDATVLERRLSMMENAP